MASCMFKAITDCIRKINLRKLLNISMYIDFQWISLLIGSLSSDVFERRTSTGSGLFAHLSHDFEQTFGQIVSIRIKTLGNKNTIASRLIKRGKGSLPVDVHRSKTSLLKLPNNDVRNIETSRAFLSLILNVELFSLIFFYWTSQD